MLGDLQGAAFSDAEVEAAVRASGEMPFALREQGMFRLAAFEVVTSTNDAVKAALKAGASEGFAASAHVQTRGYGRQGRTWVSPRGGIYLSLGLRPCVSAEQLSTLGLVASMAIRKACINLLGETAADLLAIKWPNDLVMRQTAENDSDPGSDSDPAFDSNLNFDPDPSPNSDSDARFPSMPSFKKLCGISFETCAGGACLGIGVNVYRPQEGMDVGGKNAPSYLEDLGYQGDVDQVAEAVLAAFEPLYQRWCADGFAPLCPEYAALNVLLGQEVCAVNHYTNAQIASGCVIGVDTEGRLLLRSATGEVTALSSGEVHLVG